MKLKATGFPAVIVHYLGMFLTVMFMLWISLANRKTILHTEKVVSSHVAWADSVKPAMDANQDSLRIRIAGLEATLDSLFLK